MTKRRRLTPRDFPSVAQYAAGVDVIDIGRVHDIRKMAIDSDRSSARRTTVCAGEKPWLPSQVFCGSQILPAAAVDLLAWCLAFLSFFFFSPPVVVPVQASNVHSHEHEVCGRDWSLIDRHVKVGYVEHEVDRCVVAWFLFLFVLVQATEGQVSCSFYVEKLERWLVRNLHQWM